MKEPSIENFLAFEQDHNCNSITVEGVHIWALYRYEIHNAIKRATVGRVDGQSSSASKKALLSLALNALRPFNYSNVDVLFVSDGRRNKNIETGYFENIYFDDLAKKYNSVILEHPENYTHMQPSGMDNVYFTDRLAFKTNIAVKLSRKLHTKKRRLREAAIRDAFTDIFKALQAEFGPDLLEEMVEGMTDRLYYFTITKDYCGKILDKAKPKLIIEMCYYAMECYAMSALGKERGIPTAEYSHGFAFPTHTPMQYNPSDRIPELPDAELIYSHCQDDVVHLPDNIPLITVGFPFYERERDKYKAAFPQDDHTICFISTLAEGAEISRIAAEVADAIGDEYHIIYKLHPHEFSYYKDRFPWLKNDRIEVIDTTENHIFRYLSQSKYMVATRTASVWEGIGLGCQAILLNLGDTRINMGYFIDEKQVPLVDTAQEIIDLIKNDGAGRVNPDDMFEPHAFENLCNYIDQFL